MKNIKYFLAQSIFIVLNNISSGYYLYMGKWKARVGLFGLVSALLVLAMIAILLLCRFKQINIRILLSLNIIFTIMQLFPMVEGFVLEGVYFYNTIFHIIVFLVGLFCISMTSRILRQGD